MQYVIEKQVCSQFSFFVKVYPPPRSPRAKGCGEVRASKISHQGLRTQVFQKMSFRVIRVNSPDSRSTSCSDINTKNITYMASTIAHTRFDWAGVCERKARSERFVYTRKFTFPFFRGARTANTTLPALSIVKVRRKRGLTTRSGNLLDIVEHGCRYVYVYALTLGPPP